MQFVKFHVRRTQLEQAAASPTGIRERGTACLYSNTSFVFPKKESTQKSTPRFKGKSGGRARRLAEQPNNGHLPFASRADPAQLPIERTRFFSRRRLITP